HADRQVQRLHARSIGQLRTDLRSRRWRLFPGDRRASPAESTPRQGILRHSRLGPIMLTRTLGLILAVTTPAALGAKQSVAAASAAQRAPLAIAAKLANWQLARLTDAGHVSRVTTETRN